MNLTNKLDKVDEDFTVTKYDNGFLVAVSGRDSEDDWSSAKILCSSVEEVEQLFKEFDGMERSN